MIEFISARSQQDGQDDDVQHCIEMILRETARLIVKQTSYGSGPTTWKLMKPKGVVLAAQLDQEGLNFCTMLHMNRQVTIK